jgi:hypothetical protein
MSNKKTKLFARILAGLLAFGMIFAAVYSTISFLM